jgi:hypothetical protein
MFRLGEWLQSTGTVQQDPVIAITTTIESKCWSAVFELVALDSTFDARRLIYMDMYFRTVILYLYLVLTGQQE